MYPHSFFDPLGKGPAMKLHKKCMSLFGFGFMLVANYAAALGLGGLTLESRLNEPFKAEVQLLNIGSISTDEIIVSFAAAEEFEKRQLEQFYFFSDFKFAVVLEQGKPVVHISSSRPIQEPYLGFIVELRWPTGRLQREYTVLLDMPVSSAE
jgi:pilus assembly protein FimV